MALNRGCDKECRTLTPVGENPEPGLRKVPFRTDIKVDGHTSEIWFKIPGASGTGKDGWFGITEAVAIRK